MTATALILAGGRGERFWPRSRQSYPKQFLDLLGGGKTMLQLTVERISTLIALENIFISTNETYRGLVTSQLPAVPKENILMDPVSKNTLPSIGFAAEVIRHRYGDAVMLILPSDHLILDEDSFRETLSEAMSICLRGGLITLGVKPNRYETGYGYIEYENDVSKGKAHKVCRFVEKPPFEVAKEMVDAGGYLWNSGIFIWKASTILNEVRRFEPIVANGLEIAADALGSSNEQLIVTNIFKSLPSVSIDYGVLERSDNVWVIPSAFGWDDVGSWLSLARLTTMDSQGNSIEGDVIAIDCRDMIVQGGQRALALIGMSDVVIVDSEDVLLVCSTDRMSDVRKVVRRLREQGRDDLL